MIFSIEKQTSTVYVSTKWSGGACELYHCGDSKEHASCPNLEKSFWAKMVANAIYTQIHSPTRTLDSIILEEVWSGRWPYIPPYVYLDLLCTQWCQMQCKRHNKEAECKRHKMFVSLLL